jgi:phosphatidylglycerophosphatase C
LTRDVRDHQLVVFDLDGTLTRHDTLVPYIAGLLRRRPWRWLRVVRALPTLLGFALGRRDRGQLKSALISHALGGLSRAELTPYTREFAAACSAQQLFAEARAALERHRSAGDHLVLMSASPDLYVPQLAAQLGFAEAICTEVSWSGERLEGALLSANRRGEEKARCFATLQAQHPGLATCAYGNSTADLPHLRLADHGVLVNGSRQARAAARVLGIECVRWR